MTVDESRSAATWWRHTRHQQMSETARWRQLADVRADSLRWWWWP